MSSKKENERKNQEMSRNKLLKVTTNCELIEVNVGEEGEGEKLEQIALSELNCDNTGFAETFFRDYAMIVKEDDQYKKIPPENLCAGLFWGNPYAGIFGDVLIAKIRQEEDAYWVCAMSDDEIALIREVFDCVFRKLRHAVKKFECKQSKNH